MTKVPCLSLMSFLEDISNGSRVTEEKVHCCPSKMHVITDQWDQTYIVCNKYNSGRRYDFSGRYSITKLKYRREGAMLCE
jgi:hypothetical protein